MPKTVEKLKEELLKGTHFENRTADVAEFLGITLEEAKSRLGAAQKKLVENWKKVNKKDPKALTGLYNSETFLLTRIYLDKRVGPCKAEMLYFMETLKKGDKVIEYGCGAGQNAMFLAEKGCKVTVVEIEGIMTKWLKWWFKKYGHDVKVKGVKRVDEAAGFQSKYYDALMMIAILEHVPRPIWLANKLIKAVKKNGKVFALLGGFQAKGHLRRSIRLMPQVKKIIEGKKDVKGQACMIGKGR